MFVSRYTKLSGRRVLLGIVILGLLVTLTGFVVLKPWVEPVILEIAQVLRTERLQRHATRLKRQLGHPAYEQLSFAAILGTLVIRGELHSRSEFDRLLEELLDGPDELVWYTELYISIGSVTEIEWHRVADSDRDLAPQWRLDITTFEYTTEYQASPDPENPLRVLRRAEHMTLDRAGDVVAVVSCVDGCQHRN